MTDTQIKIAIETGNVAEIEKVRKYVRKVKSQYLFHQYGDEVLYNLMEFINEICDKNGMRGVI